MNQILRTVGCAVALAAFAGCERAQVGRVYVSPSGSDAAAGNVGSPLKSLALAVDRLRQRGGGVICLADGTYELDEPLALGCGDTNIVFEAMRGARPVVSAGRRISDWTVDERGWWHTRFPAGTKFSQLYVNGCRRQRPYLPRKGYYVIADGASADPATGYQRFVWKNADVDPSWPDLTTVEMCVFHIWNMSRLPFHGADASTRTATLGRKELGRRNIFPFGCGTCYRLDNVRSALGESGDWYLASDGDLTYVPMPGETPSDTEVVAAFLPQVVRADGAGDIVFRGIAFAYANWNMSAQGEHCSQGAVTMPAAVSCERCRSVRLEDCAVLHVGAWGVAFGEGCVDCEVRRCEIADLGAGGVKLGAGYRTENGRWAGFADPARHGANCSVVDSRIEHGGRVDPAGPGVWIGFAHGCTVSRNTIRDMYYSGVSCGWRWSLGPSPTHHNVIERNRISDIGQFVLSDMGGVYTLSEQPGTEIRSNLIERVSSKVDGNGIYFDSGSAFISVYGNVVRECSSANWFLASLSASNVVTRNVFENGVSKQLEIKDRADESVRSVFRDNWVVWDDAVFGPIENSKKAVIFSGNRFYDRSAKAPSYDGFTEAKATETDLKPFADDFVGCGVRPRFTAGMPSVPAVFTPVERPEEPCFYGFEETPAGMPPADWWVYPRKETNLVLVTDRHAAGGTKSLQVTDALADWTPHLLLSPLRTRGRVTVSFSLWMEKGARPSFELRDKARWQSTPGPKFSVDGSGWLVANGRRLFEIPAEKWVKLSMTMTLGAARKEHVWRLEASVDGETSSRVFDGLALHPRFRRFDWAGFVSDAGGGVRYCIDDFVVTVGE